MSYEDFENYAETFTQAETPVLSKLNRETHLKVLNPRMLSGHLQGRLLEMFSHFIKPHRVLEIGTYTGYSAICLAAGLTQDGIIHTIDKNAELEEMVLKHLTEAGISHQVKQHIGHAPDIIPTLDEKFDIVFIDADKENYVNYYNLVFDKVKQGGLILADNVWWNGKVLTIPTPQDKDTIAIQTFNNMVLNDTRVENLLLPIRDGLMAIRKK